MDGQRGWRTFLLVHLTTFPVRRLPCRCLAVFVALVSLASGLKGESGPTIGLVPADAGLVVGMRAHNRAGEHRDFFLPIPSKSLRDYDYLQSLCGADPTKFVDDVTFVVGDPARADYAHTLIARGRFNAQILYKSAINSGAVRDEYRGLPALRVPPLKRERTEFSENTLLAIIDSHLLLLGTPEYVHLEIDRLLTDSIPDPLIARQFATVGGSDVWWIVRKQYDVSMVKKALTSLSPELAGAMGHTNLCVGTRYGRKVEFVYQIEVLPFTEPAASPLVTQRAGLSVVADESALTQGVVRVSRKRYRQWVSDIGSNIYSYR